MEADRSLAWRPFVEARAFVRELGLRTSAVYGEWSAEGRRPPDIPASPHRIYKEWAGWADWLGTVGPRPRRLSRISEILPFEEARRYVHGLILTSQRAYFAWSKSGERPANIPSNPGQAYPVEWKGWKDWLGLRLASLRPFEEAREYARSKNFSTRREWLEHSRQPDFPRDIPAYPESYYGKEAWRGWSDWLGTYQEWNHLSIVSFLDSLETVVEQLQEADLFLLLSRNGMLSRRWDLSNANLLRGLIGQQTAEHVREAKRKVRSSEEGAPWRSDTGEMDRVSDEVTEDDLELGRRTKLCGLESLEHLKTLDRLVELRITDDVELLEFLLENRIAALWQEVFEENPEFSPERIAALEGGEYTTRARDRFLGEYREAVALPLPDGYSFTIKGRPAVPNPMQRLTALRLLKGKRLGNWSGVGAGKTNAAVLAAGMMDARITVVLAANATLDGWKKSIRGMFPDAVVHVKDIRAFRPEPLARNFLVVNYEAFQQDWSEDVVRELTDRHRVDFLILDEIQLVRQRTETRVSYRREVVEGLVAMASAKNPELRVLGMSATPVVNNLHEAKKVLELVVGHELKELPTSPNLGNAINVHMLLRRVGIRHRPNFEIQAEWRTPYLDGMHLLADLERVGPGNVLALEQAVLPPKLAYLPACLRPGTMIYTHYVTGIIDKVEEVVKRSGLKPGFYTGEKKDGLEDFKAGRVDVLIGSAPIGTGVDGLQEVCDRLVFVTLPWTHAEYEQIVGRIKRKGSHFNTVEVIIPMVVLREDRAGLWSWDDLRKRWSEYKRTLADAALDGVVPLEKVISKEQMQRRSILALREWAAEVRASGPPSPAEASGGPVD